MTDRQLRTSPGGRLPGSSGSTDELSDARALRLARIRQEIEAGTYDTDERLELAFERMLERW